MPDDATLTPEEAAAYLKVNPQTVYRNLRRGLLPGAKVGRQWRIGRNDLDRFLTGRVQETAAIYNTKPPIQEPKDPVRARRALLQSELDRCIGIVKELLRPALILVYGSFARGKAGEWSDLDLVVVAETDLPFYERSKIVLRSVRPRVGLDVLVYTPAEWEEIKRRPFAQREILAGGRVIYER